MRYSANSPSRKQAIYDKSTGKMYVIFLIRVVSNRLKVNLLILYL